MIYTDLAKQRIRRYLVENNVAKSRLAFDAGVPEGSTRRVFDDKWNPTSETLRKLEAEICRKIEP